MSSVSRRRMIAGTAALAAMGGAAWALRRTLTSRLERMTLLPSFTATPALVPHDTTTDRRTLGIGRGGSPADNVDAAITRAGGLSRFVGDDDVVIVKVSAQWWNQGMTNVAAVRRLVEQIATRPGFKGEVIVFENTHFRLADGSGLSRAWARPSDRNVDVPGWDKLGDLIPHFAKSGLPVSFVGLVDEDAASSRTTTGTTPDIGLASTAVTVAAPSRRATRATATTGRSIARFACRKAACRGPKRRCRGHASRRRARAW